MALADRMIWLTNGFRSVASTETVVFRGSVSLTQEPRFGMNPPADVLCAGIMVADHVCSPIAHLPAAGELVMTERMLLTIGGCAANAAVDLAKMGVPAAVVGRVGGDIFGRVVAEMLREHGVD